MPWEDTQAREHVARTERMLAGLETLPDTAARSRALDALQSLVELYGECLDRVMGHAASAGGALTATLLGDELVSHLLLVHELHPDSVETRVGRALDEVRPYLASHGGDVELLALDGAVARVRLHGSCDGCPSSAATLELAVQDAVARAAPEILRVEAEGEVPSPQTLIPVGDLFRGPPPADPGVAAARPAPEAVAGSGWETAAHVDDLPQGRPVLREVAGDAILLTAVGRDCYAYRSRCPGCHASLGAATLDGDRLVCVCGSRYDIRRAGRTDDGSGLRLDPVPLLVSATGSVRLALQAAAR